MRILLLPLDERPCNRLLPAMLAQSASDVELVGPDPALLGHKKQPADTSGLRDFLLEKAAGCQAAVISLDMLLYGGLVPSRLHHEKAEVLRGRLDVLRRLHAAHPDMRLYAFMTLMRAPRYSSADEEPDYYGTYGRALFLRAWLADRKTRGAADDGQARAARAELDGVTIPQDVIDDYEHRRAVNASLNEEALRLVDEGVLDYLVFPQDDSSPYGYTAIAQRRLRAAMLAHPASYRRVAVYPGSDEVGMTLLCRAVCQARGVRPVFRPHFASTLGAQIVPLYEDRPMLETLGAHVLACGGRLAQAGEKADIELMIDCPGRVAQEAQWQEDRDVSYDAWRNLQAFVDQTQQFVAQGRRVAVCDSAYANGGDLELVDRLDEAGVLPHIRGYAGWNTNANTLGTTLAQAVLSDGPEQAVRRNLVARLLEDVFYQSAVRWELADQAGAHGGDYFDVTACEDWAQTFVRQRLEERYGRLRLSTVIPLTSLDIDFPWHRMFEIGCRPQIAQSGAIGTGARGASDGPARQGRA
jgi:hypothetical protein